jgi:hypothetical protein
MNREKEKNLTNQYLNIIYQEMYLFTLASPYHLVHQMWWELVPDEVYKNPLSFLDPFVFYTSQIHELNRE